MSNESENKPARRVEDKRADSAVDWTDAPRFTALGIAETWAVTVEAEGQRVLCISDQHYAGLAEPELTQFEATIRSCAHHLLGFIGAAPISSTAGAAKGGITSLEGIEVLDWTRDGMIDGTKFVRKDDVERLLSAVEHPTGDLTDEQISEIMAKYSRFLAPGLYSQTDFDCPEDMIGFARAIARAAIAAHLARQPKAEQPVTAVPPADVIAAAFEDWYDSQIDQGRINQHDVRSVARQAWRAARAEGAAPTAAQAAGRSVADLAAEAEKLAPILRGMCEGGGEERDVDIYDVDYQPGDGDVFVTRAADLLDDVVRLAASHAPHATLAASRDAESATSDAHLANQPKAEQLVIRTWQERAVELGEKALDPKTAYGLLQAEIDELRDHLARQAQAEPKCKCGNTMDVCAVTSCENATDTGLVPVAPAGAQNAEAIRNQAAPEPIECWSRDEEDFHARSLCELLDSHDDLKPGDTVWVGEGVHPEPERLVNEDAIIEHISEQAYDIGGEYADDYPDVTPEQAKELESLVAGWIKRACPPTFYTVENIKPYVLTHEDFSGALQTGSANTQKGGE
jgi:hypothetical protein